MKKIIRIAIALALVGSSLLYTGCTKDYSEELTDLKKNVTEVQAAVKSLNDFKASAQAAISKAEENIGKNAQAIVNANNAIDELDDRISDLEDYVDYYIPGLVNAVSVLYDEVTDLWTACDFLNDEIEGLKTDVDEKYEECMEAIEALDAKINGVANRITAINVIPSKTYNQLVSIELKAGEENNLNLAHVAFQVWPRQAVNELVDSTLTATILYKAEENKDNAVEAQPVEIPKPEKDKNYEYVSCNMHILSVDAATGVVRAIAYAGLGKDAPLKGKDNYYSVAFKGEDATGMKYEIGSDYDIINLKEKAVDVKFDDWKLIFAKIDEEGELIDSSSVDVTAKYTVEWDKFEDTTFFENIVPAIKFYFDPASEEEYVLTVNKLIDLGCTAFLPGESYAKNKIWSADEIDWGPNLAPFAFDESNDEFSLADGVEVEDLQYCCEQGVKVTKTWKAKKNEGEGGAKSISFTQVCRVVNAEVELGTYAYEIPWNFVNYDVTNGTYPVTDTLVLDDEDAAAILTWKNYDNSKIYVKGDATKEQVEGASFVFPINPWSIKENELPILAFLPVLAEETTYVIEASCIGIGYNYTLPIEVTVCAAPEVEAPVLETIEPELPLAEEQIFSIEVLKEFVNEDNVDEFLGNLPRDKYSILDVYEAMQGPAGVKSIEMNGEEIADKGQFAAGIELDEDEDDSFVSTYMLGYDKEYTVTFEFGTPFGVDFEFVQPISTPVCPAQIVTLPSVGEDGRARVIGTDESGEYLIEDIHLLNYVKVENNEAEDFLAVAFKIEYEVEDDYGKVSLTPEVPKFLVNPEDGVLDLDDPTIDWDEYTGREIYLRAYLLDNEDVAIDSVDFSIYTECPIVYGEDWAGAQTYTRVEGETLDVVIPKNFKYAGILNPTTPLESPEDVYGTVVVVDPSKITATVNGQPIPFKEGTHFTWNAVTKTLTIGKENNDAVIVLNVPVEVQYYIDYYNYTTEEHEGALKGTQVITINTKY